jgi:hypothetical protein
VVKELIPYTYTSVTTPPVYFDTAAIWGLGIVGTDPITFAPIWGQVIIVPAQHTLITPAETHIEQGTAYSNVTSELFITPDNVQTTSLESVGFHSAPVTTTDYNVIYPIYITSIFKKGYMSNKVLKIDGSTVYNGYTNMNGFVSVVPSIDKLYKVDVDNSTMYKNGSAIDIRYMKVTSSNDIVFIDDNDTSYSTKVDGVSNNDITSEFITSMSWGLFNGTIKVFNEERGIICDTLLPFVGSTTTSNIGSCNAKFAEIYAVDISATTVTGDNLIGQTQKWHNVSRSAGINYPNETGSPLMICMYCFKSSGDANGYIYVDGSVIVLSSIGDNRWRALTTLVPVGSTYRIEFPQGYSTYYVSELKNV